MVTIEQLEKEIDTFYDNVAASNELMRIIKEIADAIMSQNKVLGEQSALLELATANVNKGGGSETATVLTTDVEARLSEIRKSIHDIPDKITYESGGLLKKTLAGLLDIKVQYSDTFAKSNADFHKEIDAYKAHISALHEDIKKAIAAVEKVGGVTPDITTPDNNQRLDLSEIKQALELLQRELRESLTGAFHSTLKSTLDESLEPILDKTAQINIQEAVESLQKSLAEMPAQISVIPEQITARVSEGNIEITKKTLTKLLDIQTQITKDMEDYKSHISEIQNEFKTATGVLNEKYDDFLRYIETLDIRVIHEICEEVRDRQKHADKQNSLKIGDISANVEHQVEEMGKSINKKLIPVYAGMGVTVLLMIISFIMR
ncbi:MAG: hypothetical protein FWF94_07810 [Oscillospiraceae bacterium]|nr:hypothetical protein [Oscillospiraceae bacterium]